MDEELEFVVKLVEPLLQLEVHLDEEMMVLDPYPGYTDPLSG